MPNKRIDKASDVEFIDAFVQSMPQADEHILLKMGAAYVAGRVLKNVLKKR